MGTKYQQEQEVNQYTIPQLQVGLGLELRLTIEMAEEVSVNPFPLTYDGYPFC